MRVLRSHTRRAAEADDPVVTPQKRVSRKPTNKKASKDTVELPTSPPSTRKGKVTKTKKDTTPKPENEAGEASQDVVGLTDDTLPTPSPSTLEAKVTEPATEDESPQVEKETEPEEQEDEVDETSHAPVDLDDITSTPPPSNRKRKLSTEDESPEQTTPSKKQKKETAEKRLRKFRSEPPKFFDRALNRALDQRFYILTRTRDDIESCPEEDFEMVGVSGSTYTVHIGKLLSCNCPHHSLGFQHCKHIIFIMKKVLDAPDELVYQQALISTELKSIFDSAPSFSAVPQEEPVKRRPIEGDCPICYCKLEEKKKASIVWCAEACGHNFHMQCLKICARPEKVICPVCRSDWKGNKKLVTDIQKDDEQMIKRFVDAGHGISAKEYMNKDGEMDITPLENRLNRNSVDRCAMV